MIIYLLFEFDIPCAVNTVHEKSNAFFVIKTNVLMKCLTCNRQIFHVVAVYCVISQYKIAQFSYVKVP